MKLLLVGVGGVGCEFLVLLSELIKSKTNYSFIDLTVTIVDNDIVEESNLSRQRLYNKEDIGRPKVEAAVSKLKDLKLIPLKMKIEDAEDVEFFNQFNVFVLAVDNLETRRWMNSVIKNYYSNRDRDDWLLLDLGVQGFKFSLRTVRKGTACLECTMSLYTDVGDDSIDNNADIPVCSIYGQPRNLKDCVYWSLNKHSFIDDLRIIYDSAKERAKEFEIDSSKLSFEYIEGLVKRTIPAVASVNSFLAAKGLEILFKNPSRESEEFNFWMVNLESGYYELSTRLEVSEDCMFCFKNRQKYD